MAKLSNDELLGAFKEMTLLELSEFVKQFEDTFGVSAAAPVAVAAAPAGAPSGGIPFSADNLLGGVPENTAMAEDKVERLKSIRSGNLAKRG